MTVSFDGFGLRLYSNYDILSNSLDVNTLRVACQDAAKEEDNDDGMRCRKLSYGDVMAIRHSEQTSMGTLTLDASPNEPASRDCVETWTTSAWHGVCLDPYV
jgi:hypothetical protein